MTDPVDDPVIVPFAIAVVSTDLVEDECTCAAMAILVMIWVAMFAVCAHYRPLPSSSTTVVVDADSVRTPPPYSEKGEP